MSSAARMLLVVPPWRIPHTGSLAAATLRPILEREGIAVDELHGSVLFPPIFNDYEVLEAYSKFLFVPAMTGCAIEPFLDELMGVLLDRANLGGIVMPREQATFAALGLDADMLRRRLRLDIGNAAVCIDRCVERALAAPYDIVGFSATFDDQVPAACLIARRLKQARPDVRIVFGGAACFEEQADGILASFPDVDVACHTEGEGVIVPLVRALRGQLAGGLAAVPGIAWRDGGAVRHNPSPPLLRDLDELPIPDYRPFLEQLYATDWPAVTGARLMFETSRGCWWGQKQLCTFCGLNAEGLSFRAKSPERAYEEIRTLYETYPQANYLQATDNILEMRYLTTVFPRLAQLEQRHGRKLRLFYEVKSNMKREQVEAMAAGGVDCVQPGIESFSDEVLQLMRKGCTALGQIQFLKWCYQAGIEPLYNIIVANPGEKAEWYGAMLELVPFLRHLPPPANVTPMLLERFSPYHMRPEEFGITNVRPRQSYHLLYPGEGIDLERIAYQFDFDHPLYDDTELVASYRALTHELKRWTSDFKTDLAYFIDERSHLLIVDKRDGTERRTLLAGIAAQIFLYLDHHRTRAMVLEAFPAVDSRVIDGLLLTWQHRRWVCTDGKDRWLAVLPRRGPAYMTMSRPASAQARGRLPLMAAEVA